MERSLGKKVTRCEMSKCWKHCGHANQLNGTGYKIEHHRVLSSEHSLTTCGHCSRSACRFQNQTIAHRAWNFCDHSVNSEKAFKKLHFPLHAEIQTTDFCQWVCTMPLQRLDEAFSVRPGNGGPFLGVHGDHGWSYHVTPDLMQLSYRDIFAAHMLQIQWYRGSQLPLWC